MGSFIDWNEIPEDVEAIVLFNKDAPSYYKMIDRVLHVQCWRGNSYKKSGMSYEGLKHYYGDRLHPRPKLLVSNEFDWSSVDNDIEAVVLSETGELIHIYRTIKGNLHFTNPDWDELEISGYDSLKQVELSCKELGCVFLLRPTVEVVEGSVPSINDILQEAQQAILQHHNISGKVTFTVTTE